MSKPCYVLPLGMSSTNSWTFCAYSVCHLVKADGCARSVHASKRIMLFRYKFCTVLECD